MTASSSRRTFTFAAPMLIGIFAVQRAAAHNVRMVDLLLLFAGGVAFGIGLVELIRFVKARRS